MNHLNVDWVFKLKGITVIIIIIIIFIITTCKWSCESYLIWYVFSVRFIKIRSFPWMYRFSLFNLKVTRLDNRVILLVDLYSAESTSNWLSALFSDPNNFLKTRDFEVKWPWHKLTLCYLFKKLENLGPSRTYYGPKKKLRTVRPQIPELHNGFLPVCEDFSSNWGLFFKVDFKICSIKRVVTKKSFSIIFR